MMASMQFDVGQIQMFYNGLYASSISQKKNVSNITAQVIYRWQKELPTKIFLEMNAKLVCTGQCITC